VNIDLARDRAALAERIRELDRELIASTPDTEGPWIIVREDGAVYAGRWAKYSHDHEPQPFAYKWAAEKRATLDGAAVWPLAVWLASRQPEPELIEVEQPEERRRK
jgi:hypothetical protein